MSASSRGRSRGRSYARSVAPGGPPRPPNLDTVQRLGLPPVKGDAESGQFDDATAEQGKGTSASSAAAASRASPIEGKQGNIENMPNPATTEDIRPRSPDASPPGTKLNPSAPAFSPTSSNTSLSPPSNSTKLNPTTPEFSPSTSMNSRPVTTTTGHPNTHYSSPKIMTIGNKHTTMLNPRSGAFVPKISPIYVASTSPRNNSSLNVSAPEFVPNESIPSPMQNGQLHIDDREMPIPTRTTDTSVVVDDTNEGEPPTLTSAEIISGFECPIQQRSDAASEPLLKATADVLIKDVMYPGSFDRGKMKLEHTVKAWTPTEDTLVNLAEMLVHWGIREPSLRLSSSRICQVLNDTELPRRVFYKQIVCRLQVWYQEKVPTDKEQLVNFSLFFAEMFSRLRTEVETPVLILGEAVQVLLLKLLEGKEERSVINACHILKLTGPLLDAIQKEGSIRNMERIKSKLEELSTDGALPLSRKCVEIMVRVLELRAKQWGNPPSALTSSEAAASSSSTTHLNQYLGLGLGGPGPPESDPGGEGAAFIMPSEFGDAYHQAPVSNPDEWSEFLDEDDQPIEVSDALHTSDGYVMAGGGEGGQEEEELDAEMQKEFEYFVQDLEEHLLNVGEMDPEQFQDTQ